MKKVILTVSVVVLVFMGTSVLTSCGENNNTESTEQHEHMDDMGMDMNMDMNDKDVIYACPMHHNITGKEGDKCSICGMDLTNTETASEHQGHSHHSTN